MRPECATTKSAWLRWHAKGVASNAPTPRKRDRVHFLIGTSPHRRAAEQGLQSNGLFAKKQRPHWHQRALRRLATGPCNFVNQYIDFAGKIYRVLVVGNAFDQHCKFVTPIRARKPCAAAGRSAPG